LEILKTLYNTIVKGRLNVTVELRLL